MPNKRHNDLTVDGGVPNAKPGKTSDVKEGKGISWPGLPGKSGPDRSAGVKKVKTSHVSKGI